jgi:outer membrane lipoprotein-sorting protein
MNTRDLAASRLLSGALYGAVIAALLAPAAGTGEAQAPSGAEILTRVDANLSSEAKIIVSEMVIHGRRASRSIKAKSWTRGVTQSFTEYLEPAREAGTKMLKLGDELWTYTPETDRIIKISGNLLRQSVMGSDLSYKDMMEDPVLGNIYMASVAGEDTVLEKPCWVLELTAKKEDIAYFRRKVWVDKERFVILREEMYARSGKLLKTLDAKSVRRFGGRWVPDRIVFKDVMKTGDGSEFIIESMEFDAPIPDYLFSKASLRS